MSDIREMPTNFGQPTCPIDGSANIVRVSSVKLRCLDCGFMPSCSNGECGI